MKSILDPDDNMPSRLMRPVRDTAARNAILEANLPLAYWVTKRMCGIPIVANAPRDLIEDAALTGLFRAAELWREDAGTQFSTYAVLAIRSHVMNVARRHAGGKRPKKRVYLLLDVWGFQGQADADNDPWEPAQPETPDATPNYDAELVEAAMQRLSEADRTLLRQRYVNEQSMNEIGAERKLSRERIRQLQGRALARLRREFDYLKGATT